MSDKKTRVDLRKNRSKPPRDRRWKEKFAEQTDSLDTRSNERVRPKGDLSRKRTVVEEAEGTVRDASSDLLQGRVVRIHGLQNIVQTADGKEYVCAVKRVLKNLVTDERSIVTCGDRVWFRPDEKNESFIEKVEPRQGVLTRESRRKEHVLVANVEQVVIVLSLVEPDLKPHLIDRYIASATRGELKPIIVLNKIDLAEPVPLQPLVGSYAQLGIPVLLTSTRTGEGIDRLRSYLKDRSSVFSGQSGVGKSSLLNAVQPQLGLRVSHVSEVNNKGRHTTTTAQLIRLDFGGYVVDTPGIRQLQLWDVLPDEVEGFFLEFHPFIPLCGFPDCSHIHEDTCAVKKAVERGQISPRRYHSYLGLYADAKEKLDERNADR